MKERREKIKKYIISKGDATLEELAALFPCISTMTLRRDLLFLEEEGDIVRTKGGAKSVLHLSVRREEPYKRRELVHSDLKEQIAEKVSPLIEAGSTVYFDAGSTVMHIVKALGEKPLFAVTNGPNIAMELTKHPNCEISVICGRLNPDNISLSGLSAVEFLRTINFGTAVIAASGFTENAGFTCGSYDECNLKRAAIEKATRVIIVMDSTKLGHSHPFTVATPADADFFVTDNGFDPELRERLRASGLAII